MRLTTYPHLKRERNNYFFRDGFFIYIFLVYMKYIMYICYKKFKYKLKTTLL